MTCLVVYHRLTAPTGKLLAAALGVTGGFKRRDGTWSRQLQALLRQNSVNGSARFSGVCTLIRWGSQVALDLGALGETAQTLNTSAALAKAGDKLRTLRELSQAGVRVPTFALNPSELGSGVILGRSRKGSRGSDIVVYRTPQDAAGSRHDFYTAYIPNRREYRIHVVRGEVIRVQGKYLDFPGQWRTPEIKNYGNGFRFRAPNKDLKPDRLQAAIESVSALGLDFGAVDLLIGEDGLAYVLEVNTAPACSPLTARCYVEKFAQILGVTPRLEVLNAARGD